MTSIDKRKDEHIEYAMDPTNRKTENSEFDRLVLEHDCVPEISFDEIDVSSMFLNQSISAPLIIGAMTGGSREGDRINENLAKAAQKLQIPLALGSQRAAIETGRAQKIREIAPDALILGNLGATQVRDHGVEFVKRAVESVNADAMVIHFNPLQELIQPGGDTDWSRILSEIKKCSESLRIPIIAKEVGSGISVRSAKKLQFGGINWMEVAGRGGTSWARIEMSRNSNDYLKKVAEPFLDWGMDTVSLIKLIRRNMNTANLIGSGGIRNGLDVAKCLILGCDLAAVAQPFLSPARKSSEAVIEAVSVYTEQLKWALFLTGSRNLIDLKKVKIYEK